LVRVRQGREDDGASARGRANADADAASGARVYPADGTGGDGQGAPDGLLRHAARQTRFRQRAASAPGQAKERAAKPKEKPKAPVVVESRKGLGPAGTAPSPTLSSQLPHHPAPFEARPARATAAPARAASAGSCIARGHC